ncbi:hypothetical protein SO802_012391 [Lithocarpus litseifolius]|uniref:Reverse transcriptase domain-containing protein n=1 Tax=Lithocarpus litseifolius TaxID=425828 RepID=A0AAW2D2M7_9ROSI
MWLSNPGCSEIVQAIWDGGGSMLEEGILHRVEKCGKELIWWNKNVFGNVRRELEKLGKLLLKAEEEAIQRGDNTRVRQLKKEIEVWRDKEATMWAQRSRLLWARQGDRNSKYFHSCATKRHRKKLIEGIRDERGSWKTNVEEITNVLVHYYHSLFTSKGQVEASRVLEYVPNVITDEMNGLLSRRFDVHEVEVALQQMAPLKAPGPDGMPPLFYQHFWGTVSQDVTSSILMWLNSVLVNGEPCGMIHPTRGIRQGDPISPFLFLLCTEGLNGLIKKAERNGDIHGFSLCRRGPKLTHLLFADDSLLFCRATMEECSKVLDLLSDYEDASGQQINKSKTALFFSKAMDGAIKDQIKEAWGVPEIMQYEKYLGLPSFVGKRKKASFNYIKERVWRKIQGWEGKLLSQAGREVLIKSVIQAIPTYTMGCFKIPVGLCNEIEAMIKKFWWGQRGDRRKIHWVKWDELTKAKDVGGMGFRDLAKFNDSLLAKQAWRLLHNQNSLFYKVFKARFFPNSTIMEAKDSRLGSYAWRSILVGREVIQRGARWRVGDGKKIRIWQDHWLPRKHPPQVLSCPLADFENAKVDVLIDPRSRRWNEDMVDGLFSAEEAELIKKIPLSQEAAEDILFWPHSCDGRYNCKTGYRFLKEEEELNVESRVAANDYKHVWREIWSLKVPPKVKSLLWRACRNAMPTKNALFQRKIAPDHLCDRCHASAETPLHALWSCSELDSVWTDVELWSNRSLVQFVDFKELLSWQIKNNGQLELFAVTAWTIWNQRNRVRLNQPADALHQLAHLSKAWLEDYQGRQVTTATPVQQGLQSVTHWKPPPSDFYKINFDGAVFPNEKKTGVGVVIRDHRGWVIASCSKLIHQQLDCSEIEAFAAGWALSFALDVGVNRAVLEGDSWSVIKGLMEEERLLTPLGLLIEDAKKLSHCFVELCYSHAKRECNRLAHNLARYAVCIPDFFVWMEDVPSQFQNVLQADSVGLFQ